MKIINYNSLVSTNITAKEMLNNSTQTHSLHGTVITADRQTGGKGRYDRKFFSPAEHGIYMSVIVNSELLNIGEPTLLTPHAAVAVCKAIEVLTDKTPLIKWVNDIFLNGKKICGILAESCDNLKMFIVGIGLNFTEPNSGFPHELSNIATSLFLRDEHAGITKQQLIEEIARNVLTEITQPILVDNYRQKQLLFGKRVSVYRTASETSFDATVVGVDEMCRLIVSADDGKLLTLCSGEVRIKPTE